MNYLKRLLKDEPAEEDRDEAWADYRLGRIFGFFVYPLMAIILIIVAVISFRSEKQKENDLLLEDTALTAFPAGTESSSGFTSTGEKYPFPIPNSFLYWLPEENFYILETKESSEYFSITLSLEEENISLLKQYYEEKIQNSEFLSGEWSQQIGGWNYYCKAETKELELRFFLDYDNMTKLQITQTNTKGLS